MMKKMLILSCLIAGMLVSCSSDDGISVKFQLKDENGNEKYVFKNNENIIFSLDIINNGEEGKEYIENYNLIFIVYLGFFMYHVYV